MTKVAVVILNWNRADDTIECIESIGKLRVTARLPARQGYELDVVVVDNGSTQENLKKLKKPLFTVHGSPITIIKNTHNLGFAEGNNVGIRYAMENNADYVLILNNDTIVDAQLIIGLLKTFKEHKNAGAVSPKIYFAKGFEFHKDRYNKVELGKVIWYAGGTMDWNNIYGTNRGVDKIDRGQFDEVVETDFATGACVMFPAKVLKKVGFFDEKYFMYLEDADLSQRIKKADFKVLYSPYGFLWHKVAQSSAIGGNLNDYFITRNRLLFGMKYAKLRSRLALYKESMRFLVNGREWQKKGVVDYYLGRLGKGSWSDG